MRAYSTEARVAHLALGLMLAAAAPEALAEPVAYSFVGSVDAVSDPGGDLSPPILAGDAVSLVFEFDGAAFSDDNPDPNWSTFDPVSADFTATLGAHTFQGTGIPFVVDVIDNVAPGDDFFFENSASVPQSGGLDFSAILVEFYDASGSALGSAALPAPGVLANSSSWSARMLEVSLAPSGGGFVQIFGTISAVPPPPVSALDAWAAGALAAAIALAGLAISRQRSASARRRARAL